MERRRAHCARTAEFVSLELDGELSLFERVMLKHHLQRCESCSQFANSVAGLTQLLRAEPQEEFRLPIDLVRPRRRVSLVVRSFAVTAAVAGIGVWLGVALTGSLQAPAPVQTFNPPHAAATEGDARAWPAGLPRTPRVVQLSPGGLHTMDISP